MKTTIDMAREAGIFVANNVSMVVIVKDQLERFADLVRAEERDLCAQVVEEYPHWLGMTAKAEISNAIRNRGNT